MVKQVLLTMGMVALFFSLKAQTITDALRLSQTYVEGTARTLGAGGSINALGADFSVLSSNPAGLAAYRKSEFVISPGLVSTSTDALLQGGNNQTINATKNSFTLHNAGMVIASNPTASDWKTINFGFGINRIAGFRDRFEYTGSTAGSITDRFLELAEGYSPDELDNFEAGLAFETGAIYDNDGDYSYDSDFLLYALDQNVYKEQIVNTTGGITELALSLAGNYNDRLFVGATFAIPFVNYNEEKTYRELDSDLDEIPFFNSLGYNENLATTGAGFQFKMGLIYRATQAIRIGFGIHSPSWYKLTDQYNSTMSYSFTDNNGRQSYTSSSPDGIFEYRVSTPWRMNGSLGVIVGRFGFVHVDAEWQDYRGSRFSFIAPSADDAAYERSLNNSIEENYQSAFNIRTGGEIALDPFRLRAGIGFLGSPFAGEDAFTKEYTAGVGIRERAFFIDLGYRLQNRKEGYVPYFTANSDFNGDGVGDAPQQFVTTERVRHQFIMTVGFKF